MPDDIAPTTPAAAPAVETPATPTADATPPKEAAAPTLEEAMASLDVSKMTDAQLADLESGDTERVRSALGLTNDKPADKAPAAAAPTAPEGTPSPTDKAPSRVSLRSLPAATAAKLIEAINLARDGSMSFEEAQAKIFGAPAAAPAPATAAAPAAPAPAAEPEPPPPSPAALKVEELTAKVTELKTKYDDAKKVYSPDADAIFEEYLEAKADVKEAQREAVAYDAKAKEWNAAQAASQERATLKFSDLITDPESNFLGLCDDEIALAEMKNDPILTSPDWPEKIGERVKGKYFKGYDANSAAAGEDEPTTIPPAPNQRVRLPGSPVGPGFAAGTMSPQTALSEFDKLTTEQQEALILEVNKLPAPRR